MGPNDAHVGKGKVKQWMYVKTIPTTFQHLQTNFDMMVLFIYADV